MTGTRRLLVPLGSIAAALLPAPAAVAKSADHVMPPWLDGSYAPGGDCAQQPRLRVDRTGIHLDTAAGKRGPLPITVSFTWGAGARYSGDQVWVLVGHGGKDAAGKDRRPLVLTFNAREQRGMLAVDRNEPGALDGPLASILQARSFRLCRTGAPEKGPTPGGIISVPRSMQR